MAHCRRNKKVGIQNRDVNLCPFFRKVLTSQPDRCTTPVGYELANDLPICLALSVPAVLQGISGTQAVRGSGCDINLG